MYGWDKLNLGAVLTSFPHSALTWFALRMGAIMRALALTMLSGFVILSSQASADGASPKPATFRRLKAFEGRALYAIEPGYQCKGFGPGAARIASWRGKIEVRDGQIIDWGDRCTNEGLPVAATEVKIGLWGRGIKYQGRMYRPDKNIEHKLAISK